MDTKKRLTDNPLFWIVVAVALLGTAAAVIPAVYGWHDDWIASEGVMSDYRKADPCTPDSANPCIMPDGTRVDGKSR